MLTYMCCNKVGSFVKLQLEADAYPGMVKGARSQNLNSILWFVITKGAERIR